MAISNPATPTPMATYTLIPVQIINTQVRSGDYARIQMAATPVLDAAGGSGRGLKFDVSTVDETGYVFARRIQEATRGTKDERTIQAAGEGMEVDIVTVPAIVLEAFGYDRDAIVAGDVPAPSFVAYAAPGEGIIALEDAGEFEIEVDALFDD